MKIYSLVILQVVALALVSAQSDPFSGIDANCLGAKIAMDPSILQCMPDGANFDRVCQDECFEKLDNLYRRCNGTILAELFSEVCARDQNGNRCVNVLDSLINTTNPTAQNVETACASMECEGQCREAVESIGCCYRNALNIIEALGIIDTATLDMLNTCNVQPCSGAKATAIFTLPVLLVAVLLGLMKLF